MSGLLQRLAAQATGRAWTVRSAARLPWGAERLAEAAPDAAPPWTAAAPGDAQRPASPGMPMPEPLPIAAEALKAPIRTQPPQALLPERAGAAPMVEQQPAAPATTAEASLPHMPFGNESAPPDATPAWPADPAPLRPTQHTAAARAHAPHTEHAGPATPIGALPAPMLPPQRPQAPAVTRPTNHPAQQPIAAAAAAAPDEVHIHIGRIELTAVQPPPPAAPRRRERAQPLSLDAYLARRQRGSAP